MKVEIKGFIHKDTYGKGYSFFCCDMSAHGYVMVGPHTFEYDVPADFNPVAAEVAAIEKTLDSMADEYHGKVRQLKERIANLQCIEHKPVGDV